MPATPNEGAWFNPKWLVIAVALTAFALILNYDLRLGLAAGALLGLVGVVWLFAALRYGSLNRGEGSGRSSLVAGVQQQTSNRRIAVQRAAEQAALLSGSQQRPEPTQRP
jgi:MFS superfamily sulfate permease-like transporter